MTRLTMPHRLIALAVLLAPLQSFAQDTTSPDAATDATNRAATADTRAYEESIAAAEARGGAYSADLAETLLGLGLALQSQDRHPEAIENLKRGVHLTRINNGLYSTAQIPLLLAEINSHMALGDYAEVDQRQAYLYRVQMKSSGEDGTLADAYMQQANWQYSAYQLGLGDYNFSRLMNMWDLYRSALEERSRQDGEDALTLLPPLQGMLRTLYLMSAYEFPQSFQVANEDITTRSNLHRFNAYKSQAFERGNTVIAYMRAVEEANGRDYDAARAQILLGNWNLLHGKRGAAWQAYGQAETELTPELVAQYNGVSPLTGPVALPESAELRALPPAVPKDEGDILLEFGITATGKVVDLERLDENEELDGKANRLMRQLRRTRFRPKFEAGEPVATQSIIRAYDIQ